MCARRVPGHVLPALTLALAGLLPGGCPRVPSLPDEFDVATSGLNKETAAADSGPPELADSSWWAFRVADAAGTTGATQDGEPAPGPYGGLLGGTVLARPPAGEVMFRVHFGDHGQIAEITENRYFLPEIYGSTIAVGKSWAPTTLPGVQFRSATFGLSLDNHFGVAILAQVRLGPVLVGRAILYAWGTRGAEHLDGTFGYLLDFSEGVGNAVLDSSGDQYPFYATRRAP